jgi:hypothetical protein
MSSKQSIVITVTHPSGEEALIKGFRYIWAFYVKGYNPEKHCQPGLIGQRVDEFCTPTAMSGRSVTCDKMDRYPYLYVCGVGAGRKEDLWKENFHLPLSYAAGSVVEKTSYNGYRFRVENAAEVVVPELREGWEGKPREHTRCKNFQFAVACFGYPPGSAAL